MKKTKKLDTIDCIKAIEKRLGKNAVVNLYNKYGYFSSAKVKFISNLLTFQAMTAEAEFEVNEDSAKILIHA